MKLKDLLYLICFAERMGIYSAKYPINKSIYRLINQSVQVLLERKARLPVRIIVSDSEAKIISVEFIANSGLSAKNSITLTKVQDVLEADMPEGVYFCFTNDLKDDMKIIYQDNDSDIEQNECKALINMKSSDVFIKVNTATKETGYWYKH